MIQTLTPQEADSLISQGNVDVVDVREPSEWARGHIPRSRLVPLAQLKAEPNAALKSDRVIFVCAKGVRSLAAARVAETVGLTELYNLDGGTSGWARAGLPLVQD